MSREVGFQAEEQAASELEKNGYTILDRNYFARVGEIDIVAEKDDTICFVEVKYRNSRGFGTAIDTVTKQKMLKILKAAKRYLFENELMDSNWRVNVVTIDDDKLEIIENVYIEGMS